jgi:hypothetical protein
VTFLCQDRMRDLDEWRGEGGGQSRTRGLRFPILRLDQWIKSNFSDGEGGRENREEGRGGKVRADEAWTGTELVSWLLRCDPFRSRPLNPRSRRTSPPCRDQLIIFMLSAYSRPHSAPSLRNSHTSVADYIISTTPCDFIAIHEPMVSRHADLR